MAHSALRPHGSPGRAAAAARPFISVIVPVRNEERSIARVLDGQPA